MPDDLRTVVITAMWDSYEGYITRIPAERLADHPFKQAKMEHQADAAITAALSWLAAEAKRREAMQGSPMFYENNRWYSVSDWLIRHIPPGQEGERDV